MSDVYRKWPVWMDAAVFDFHGFRDSTVISNDPI